MKFNQLIAKRVRMLLNERQWTQYQLSQKSGLPKSTISYTLKGRNMTLKTDTLLNICRGFNISVFEFFNHPSFYPENIADD